MPIKGDNGHAGSKHRMHQRHSFLLWKGTERRTQQEVNSNSEPDQQDCYVACSGLPPLFSGRLKCVEGGAGILEHF